MDKLLEELERASITASVKRDVKEGII